MVPTVTEPEVARAYGKVRIEDALKGPILDLNPRSIIPDSLHIATDIPFMRPYAYKVVAYGRYTAGMVVKGVKVGGRFGHEEWDLTSSRPLTKEEIEDMARSRLGKKGGTPRMEIFNVQAVAAYFREET